MEGMLNTKREQVNTSVEQRLATLKNAKKVRTIADIENCPFVNDLWREENDQWEWWVCLEDGYHSEDTECCTFHFPTIKEVCSYINAGVYVVEWIDDANHWCGGYWDRHYVKR
jgi:hypothetical protein